MMRPSPRNFLYAGDLVAEAQAYFTWCDDHPLKKEQVYQYKGSVVRTDSNLVRPYTKTGLATFFGISTAKLNNLRNRGDDWADAMDMIEQVIYTQKFENAAANLLNASFISRDLGLADKQELSGPNGGPIKTEENNPRERIASRLAGLAARTRADGDPSGTDQ